MKKRLLFFIVSMFSVLSVFAADQFYVIMKDGSVESYPTDKVDSLTFDDPKIEKILGFNEMAERIVKLEEKVEQLEAKLNTMGNGSASSLAFGFVDAKDLPSLGVSTDTVVDMGLSVKWTSFNVGASKCYESGDYYAWGETKTKEDYSRESSLTDIMNITQLEDSKIIDENGNLTVKFDVATQKWGNKYRMPTRKECQELIDICSWVAVKVVISADSYMNGYIVKSPRTGNAIFLPSAGHKSFI